jgi:CRISPR/Cas system-associated protein Csm6
MEARDRLRLLSMEMELQRAWLAAYMDEREARAARRRHSVVWRVLMSLVRAKPLWVAVLGAAKWWREQKPRTA